MAKQRFDPKAPRLAFHGFGKIPMHDGTNVTVRLGDKWLKTFERGGVNVVMLDGEGNPIGEAVIEKVAYLRFADVPEAWLIQQHDPYCTTLSDLLDAMKYAYENAVTKSRQSEVSPNDYVTVVWFVPG